MKNLLRIIKKGLFEASMDATIFSLVGLSKNAIVPLVKIFLGKAGGAITEEAVDQIISLLPMSEKDEQMLDDAFIYIETDLGDPNVRSAWSDLMLVIEGLVTDHNEAEKLKEYWRKLSVKETVQKTALKLVTDVNMPPDEFTKYINALSIQRKVLEPKYKSFLDYVKEEGKDFLVKAQEYNSNVAVEIDAATNNLEARNNADEAKIAKLKKWF